MTNRLVFTDEHGNYAKPEEAKYAYGFDTKHIRLITWPPVDFTSSNHTIYKGEGRYVER